MTEGEARGVVGAATELGGKLITSTPAQFLILCVINILFIAGLLMFLDREQANRVGLEQRELEARERVILPLMRACISQGMRPGAPGVSN